MVKSSWIRRYLIRILAVAGLLHVFTTNISSAQEIRLENERVYTFVLFDVLEFAPFQDVRPVRWDMIGSIGKDYNRFWIKSDGDVSTAENAGEMEFQALYSRLIAPYWEAQAGVRFDVNYFGEEMLTRVQLAIGLEGLAPYWFELAPSLFISDDGDVSASLTGSYDLFVTQTLILQPRLDASISAQDVPAWGVESGLNNLALSARIRYEIRREFAPYVGFVWTLTSRGSGEQDLILGDDSGTLAFVVGVRLWR